MPLPDPRGRRPPSPPQIRRAAGSTAMRRDERPRARLRRRPAAAAAPARGRRWCAAAPRWPLLAMSSRWVSRM